MSDNPNDELPEDQPPDDFANFDPAAYVAKHNQEMGRHLNLDDPVNEEVRHANRGTSRSRRNRRRPGGDEDEIMNDVPVGLMGSILGIFRSGENVHLYSEILGEALPIAGRYLPIIGCVIVFICVIVCGGGYLLINALTHR